MHFNKMIIAGLLVCCSLTAVACGKNRENTSVVTSEYNAANVKDYEEDGVKYREETGAKQTIIYPLMEHDCADMEQAAVCSINGKQSETDVRDTDTSYIIISSFKWPVLYNDDDVEKIVYKTYNARVRLGIEDDLSNEYQNKKKLKMDKADITAGEQEQLKMILCLELKSTNDSWYMNKQSPESERQAKNEVLNSVLVEAEISYKDGTSHTDYYKLETIENGNSVNIFKLSE